MLDKGRNNQFIFNERESASRKKYKHSDGNVHTYKSKAVYERVVEQRIEVEQINCLKGGYMPLCSDNVNNQNDEQFVDSSWRGLLVWAVVFFLFGYFQFLLNLWAGWNVSELIFNLLANKYVLAITVIVGFVLNLAWVFVYCYDRCKQRNRLRVQSDEVDIVPNDAACGGMQDKTHGEDEPVHKTEQNDAAAAEQADKAEQDETVTAGSADHDAKVVNPDADNRNGANNDESQQNEKA